MIERGRKRVGSGRATSKGASSLAGWNGERDEEGRIDLTLNFVLSRAR